MLNPEMQLVLAKGAGAGPSNKTVELERRRAGWAALRGRGKKLITVDWDVINPVRDEWNKRWTREIER